MSPYDDAVRARRNGLISCTQSHLTAGGKQLMMKEPKLLSRGHSAVFSEATVDTGKEILAISLSVPYHTRPKCGALVLVWYDKIKKFT